MRALTRRVPDIINKNRSLQQEKSLLSKQDFTGLLYRGLFRSLPLTSLENLDHDYRRVIVADPAGASPKNSNARRWPSKNILVHLRENAWMKMVPEYVNVITNKATFIWAPPSVTGIGGSPRLS